MFTGVQFTHFIQANPALAVFLTVALGFCWVSCASAAFRSER